MIVVMKSIEASKSKQPRYNDPEIQKMYEWAMWELANQEADLQAEIQQNWPKTNEEAKKFIKKWEIWAVAKYVDNYQWLDSEVAEALIKNWYKDAVLSHLGKYNCDKNLAIVLIKYKEWKHVARFFHHFKEAITPSELIKLCMQYKYKEDTLLVLRTFVDNNSTWKFDNNVAHYLLNTKEKLYFTNGYSEREKTGPGFLVEYLNRFEWFEWFDDQTAMGLIKQWYLKKVVENLSSFSEINQEKLVDKIMELENFDFLWENKDKFNQKWKSRLIEIAIKEWYIKKLVENLSSFSEINQEELVDRIVELEDFDFLWKNKDKFNQKWKNRLLEIAKTRNNYHMVKDVDGKMKPYEKIIDRIKKLIPSVNLPWLSELSVTDVKLIWWDFNIKWFDINVWKGKLKQNFRVEIDPVSWKETFKIPWLEWLKAKDTNEFLRVVYLLVLLRGNSGKYVWAKDWLARYNGGSVMFGSTVMAPYVLIDKYCPSVRNCRGFIEYVNKF